MTFWGIVAAIIVAMVIVNLWQFALIALCVFAMFGGLCSLTEWFVKWVKGKWTFILFTCFGLIYVIASINS